MVVKTDYTQIVVEVIDQIGIIKLNRPKALNTFTTTLLKETINAVRELNDDPRTVFTVLTGEGRFFSAGADISGADGMMVPDSFETKAEAKLAHATSLFPGTELVRTLIEHKKVFIFALNGPAVGGGAAWFSGLADFVLAVEPAYLQIPFASLGIVPEHGCVRNLSQTIGVHRTNDLLMFGRKLTAPELLEWGLVNRIFPLDGFLGKVVDFLQEKLRENDGQAMMIAKQLQNAPLRAERLLALYDAADALAERFVDGAPYERFMKKFIELAEKKKKQSHL